MTFSPEQEAILDREGSFCINATAGSGKTTTLCAWASLYSTKSTIALTYNGSSKADMIRKRDSLGITNLAVESIHSLAQKGVFRPNNRPKTFELSLTSSKVVELLKLQDLPGKENSCYLLGKWTSRVLSFFLNSTVASFDDLVPEYFIEESFDPDFVNNFDIIVKGSSTIYELMKSQKIPMLHDVYLKMFWQLGHNIPHDAVLFDEGQDASPIMLDIFLRQEGLTKIIVGDEHQQIYSWRYARNALDSTGLDKMFLTSCFRFSSRISKLANEVLEWKRKLGIPFSTPPLTGCRENYPNPFPECYSSGIIARTNTGLLSTAIRLLADDHPCMKSISFEGNFESYKFAENGESIYDVLNVFDGKREFIKSPMLKNMRSFSELKNYCLLANDSSLSMQVSLVEKYKKDIIRYMKELTEKNKKQNNQPPDLMFSTAHKSKGMEYEEVSLADDFMLFNELQDKLTRREISQARACEEINLLYVSITRSKGLAWVSPRLNDSLGQSKI